MMDEMEMQEKRLKEERLIREKRMELERMLEEKKILQERELQEMQLEQEKKLLEQKLQGDLDFSKQQRALRDKYDRARSDLLLNDQDEFAAGDCDNKSAEKVHGWLLDPRNRDPSKSIPFDEQLQQTPKCRPDSKRLSHKVPENIRLPVGNHLTVDENMFSSRILPEANDSASVIQQFNHQPTKTQLLARSVLGRPLPIFSGRAEEWPLFISSFINSTEACGFNEQENLVRLQECLKGAALETVRSRLMLPSGVNKVRKSTPPRADRLESFIPFGLAVQELCDHLEAAQLQDHLVNPELLQELVEKLPAGTKREWVQFKRAEQKVTLKTFAEFTSNIASEANEVILVVDQKPSDPKFIDRARNKEKGFIHAHNAHETSSLQSPPVPSICRVCRKENHRVRNCEEFRKKTLTERLRLMEQLKLCDRCLNEHTGWCRFKITCNIGACRLHHHPLVHRRQEFSTPPPVPVFSTPAPPTERLNVHVERKPSVILRIIPVTLFNGSQSVKTLAYLDEGASMTLIEESLVRELNARGVFHPMTLQWTSNIVRQEASSQCLSLAISGDSGKRFKLRDAHTVKKMHLPKQAVKFSGISNQHRHLQGISVPDRAADEPRILIGLNNIFLFAPLESRTGAPLYPIAVRSHLGWSIYGPLNRSGSDMFVGCHNEYSNQDLHDQMREYFFAEEPSLLVKHIPESKELERARAILDRTTVWVDGRYESGLLWRSDDIQLPDSYAMARKRCDALERRLKNNPQLDLAVRQKIDSYLVKQYAHKATPQELASATPGRIWFLPLNVVIHPKKPEKIRLVWDAAAKVQGVSLNSMLLPGPDLLTSLPAVLQRFRERTVAFGADIREMYHQIRVQAADRHAQRFLFRSDPIAEPEIYIMDVCTFGSACSPAVAQHVKRVNAHRYAQQFPEAVDSIDRRHYVDDYLDCANTEDEAIVRAKQMQYIHHQGGFELHGWISNSSEVLRALGALPSEEVSLSEPSSSGTERVLGIIWKPQEDTFTFSTTLRENLIPYFYNDKRPTKRIALSGVMSLFDPLGFLSPFTVHGKLLLQELWRTGCDWDECIDDDNFAKWQRFTSLLPEVEAARIQRCYLQGGPPSSYETLELHTFVDASEQAFGAASYFRIAVGEGYKCSLIMSKTKVCPLKQLSIPRCELSAAVLGSQMAHSIEAEHDLKVTRRVFWTDSRTVLSWIRSDQRRYKPFVGFRIGTILQNTRVDEWRWVPTKFNIADILTKWSNESFLAPDSSWFLGPKFLHRDESEWPEQPVLTPNTTQELRTFLLHHSFSTGELPIIDVRRISKWAILLRTLCCVFRFLSNCHRKKLGEPIETVETPEHIKKLVMVQIESVKIPLKQEEFEKAENLLWKIAQRENYNTEIATLLNNQRLPKEQWSSIEKSSSLYRLAPFLDEYGVLRVDGRTSEASFVPYDTRFPIILPRDHVITNHLLNYYHQRFAHANKETIFNELRQRFHVSKLRPSIKAVQKQCQWCKVQRTRPGPARMAPLPIERLTPFIKPFSYVGIDYFGPIDVAVGRRSEKRWIVLFTCLSVRAIHLEVAYRLNVDSCIMAIRRFVLRRGPPISFYFDNGTNFQAASKELLQQIRRIDQSCANTFTNARTRWSFNPPSAPHMGGIWERMVRSTKAAMATLSSGNRMTDEILLTVIAEAEEIVNTRPLVYLPQDSQEAEALTPNSFIRGTSSGQLDLPMAPTDKADSLRSLYHRSQYIADELWKRWLKEYLPSLNIRTKWLEEHKPLQKGDLVFITDDLHRNNWVRGMVDEVIQGKDGHVRQALVRTSSKVIRRPVTKLAVIEVGSSGKSDREASSGQGLRAGEVLEPLVSARIQTPPKVDKNERL
ncbi:uncharacterized protein LOC129752929 [Uranotaenia lowii]|uniref:uncharacterized protein LOC129752929 n=1 Tax=Uranotaenia lowii TaxID=190385 RepID=UPI0024784363|nr:uncharacterized protein LOC129752929 [Uranotaenia lowii]